MPRTPAPMENDIQRLTRAFNFAAQRHIDQRRKDYRAAPYINHPANVADLVTKHTGGNDINLIIAALLHDTVEDVGVTFEELEREFGKDVADLVREVTDDKNLPKAVRKELQIEHAAHATERAKILKLADKVSNLNDLLVMPPRDWDNARVVEYFNWASKVVAGCRGANAGLEKEFDAAYLAGAAKYNFAPKALS